MTELASNFGIDWKLLLAQVVNFVILVFLLKKFAYQPFIELLDKRKNEIEKGKRYTDDAEEKLKSVDKIRQVTLDNAKKEALKIISESEDKATRTGEERIQKAEEKIAKIVEQGKKIILKERQKAEDEILTETKVLIAEALKKIINSSPSKVDKELTDAVLAELKKSYR